MEVSGGGPHDPWQWLYLVLAGMLGAAGKHIYEVLWGVPRPAGGEHSEAYLIEKLNQMIEAQDTMQATLEGFERRLRKLERSATAGD